MKPDCSLPLSQETSWIRNVAHILTLLFHVSVILLHLDFSGDPFGLPNKRWFVFLILSLCPTFPIDLICHDLMTKIFGAIILTNWKNKQGKISMMNRELVICMRKDCAAQVSQLLFSLYM